ncbi:MAG TPA: glycerol-3-phosphate 1-O-acyltransferase [Phycisphaerales bacterium]|nr:glycerol-3-phosphate 1-O-acyltransferase [Phycisphaerales bacterium]
MEPLARLGMILAAYHVGAIPFGLLIGRAKGIDIRDHGSGNIGATNVGRVLGKQFFILCFICDALKGAIPTLAFGLIFGLLGSADTIAAGELAWWLGAMVAPVLGHMFSPFLGFKGGKGVATGLGAMLAVFPYVTIPAAAALVVFLVALRLWRYVGVSSCLAAVTLPITETVLVLAGPDRFAHAWPAVVVLAALAAVVIVKHRGNLARTLAGTEPRVGSPRTDPQTDQSADHVR